MHWYHWYTLQHILWALNRFLVFQGNYQDQIGQFYRVFQAFYQIAYFDNNGFNFLGSPNFTWQLERNWKNQQSLIISSQDYTCSFGLFDSIQILWSFLESFKKENWQYSKPNKCYLYMLTRWLLFNNNTFFMFKY